jgi:hypothetical protein
MKKWIWSIRKKRKRTHAFRVNLHSWTRPEKRRKKLLTFLKIESIPANSARSASRAHTETRKRPESSAFDDQFAAIAHTHTKALTESSKAELSIGPNIVNLVAKGFIKCKDVLEVFIYLLFPMIPTKYHEENKGRHFEKCKCPLRHYMTYLMAAFCGGKIICTIKGTFQLH